MAPSISIVVPTLNAGRYLPELLPAFARQQGHGTPEVILVDSASDDDTVECAAGFPFVRVIPIRREDFTHGYARNLGVREAGGELVVFISQDARPEDERWLAELAAPFADPGVGGAFSRQIPYPDANPIESTYLAYWFPEEPHSLDPLADRDRERIRFLDTFFSNVSSATRRELAMRHPFREDIIMSEDQQFARDVSHDGFGLVYASGSRVRHSHTYSLKQVFQRYFDSAYSLTQIFGHTLSESVGAGRGYLPHEFKTIATRHPLWLPYYGLHFLAKGFGVLAGHHADRLPRRLARALSMHKGFWDRPQQRERGDIEL